MEKNYKKEKNIKHKNLNPKIKSNNLSNKKVLCPKCFQELSDNILKEHLQS